MQDTILQIVGTVLHKSFSPEDAELVMLNAILLVRPDGTKNSFVKFLATLSNLLLVIGYEVGVAEKEVEQLRKML
jgi:hypothetical protein